MSREYDDQRIRGAKLIESKITKDLADTGVAVDAITWNDEDLTHLVLRDTHRLTVKCDNIERSIEKIPDEWLADYPGGVGNEKLDTFVDQLVAHIREACS